MIFISVIFVIILIISFIKPFFGLLSFMAILYLRPMEFFPELVPFHIAQLVAGAAFLGFLAHRDRKKKFFLNYKEDKILLFFLFVILLSFSVGWIPKCWEVFEKMFKNLLLYIMIVNLVNTEKRLKITIWAILIMSGILAFDVVQKYLALYLPHALDPHVERIGAFTAGKLGGGHFGGPGDFAVMMNIVIPLAFFCGISGRPLLLRPFALIFGFLFILGMMATHARGGLVSFGSVMLGISYFGIKSKGIIKKSISIFMVVISIVGLIAFAPAAFKERAATIMDYTHEGTAQSRIEYWKLGIKMFLSNPLIGVGAGNYIIRYPDFGGWDRLWRVPHNMYIEALSELGILGFGCLFFLLYFTFKDSLFTDRMLKKKKKTDSFLYIVNQGVIVSLFAYCVGGMFETLLYYPMFYILIAVIITIRTLSIRKINEVA